MIFLEQLCGLYGTVALSATRLVHLWFIFSQHYDAFTSLEFWLDDM